MTPDRLTAAREKMRAAGFDALIVLGRSNVRWLSGFAGSNGAIALTSSDLHLFTDGRYTIQAAEQAPLATLHISSSPLSSEMGVFLKGTDAAAVGFDPTEVTYEDYRSVKSKLRGRSLTPLKGLVSELRYTKDASERESLAQAAAITDAAFSAIAERTHRGITENELSAEVSYALRKCGAESESFPNIVASGPRSALPHASPSDRVLQEGDIVLLDFGAQYEGYAGDITRTFVLGKSDARFKEIYGIVLQAQISAIEKIKARVPGRDVDGAARDVIRRYGYAEAFTHGTGHQIGLEVHDGPALSQTSDVVLEEGMVVTVEPGIYLEGWGGVRIEDDVVVTAEGCELLTRSTKTILEI